LFGGLTNASKSLIVNIKVSAVHGHFNVFAKPSTSAIGLN